MEAAGDENLLYNVRQVTTITIQRADNVQAALFASKTIEELDAVKRNNTWNGRQVIFQQVPKQSVFNVLNISAC
jgi:L-lactate dehydrogenase (cytochrome)